MEPRIRMTDVYRGDPPASESIEVKTVDVDEARDLLNRFYYPLTIRLPDRGAGFSLDLEVIQLGPLTVGQLGLGTQTTLVTEELDGYHVTLPTAGVVFARQHQNEVLADPWTAAVFRPGRPVYTSHPSNSCELDVKINGSALEAELAAQLGHPVDGPLDLAPSMTLKDGPARGWARFVRMLHGELGNAESLVRHPLIGEQLRQSVISGLLLSVPHRYRDELLRPPLPVPPRALRHVVDVIHDEPERAFTVTTLAEIGGMSVRSLQEGFRRYVGAPPMAYLQQIRLGRARTALRDADPATTTVASVAHRWGFAHLGRFASAYRAEFGESPSETLRQG
jgi:AraC-like DNA-binding protein